MSFVDVVLGHLEAHPDRAFVCEAHGDRMVPTRGGRLREMIEQARGWLRRAGVTPGDRVVLVASNSARWVACDLAILAEGATCVPLYARQAPSELAGMIADCEPRVILVEGPELEAALRASVPSPAGSIAVIDSLFSLEPADDIAPVPARRIAPDHPVTIIYTSGSSGEPKGVITTLANVEHMLPVLDAKLRELKGGRGGADRVFHYLPLCFSGSRMVLWTCLFRGNGIHLSMQLSDLAREMKSASPEYFLNVPALLDRIRSGVEAEIAKRPLPVRMLYQRAIEAFRRERRGVAGKRDRAALLAARSAVFPKIRERIGPRILALICGSAPLSEETQIWFVDLIGIPVYQVYGLTETTAIVSIDRLGAIVPGRVGHPIPGCEIKLGEGGELLVRGPNVFPGYWRKPEATRDAFLPGGWLRTGDQATIDERGSLAIVGRVKNLLVPSSGHNVAPEPLEQMLTERLPGVAQAVVLGHGRPYLVALLTGTAARPHEIERALDRVNDELPHYRRIRRFHLHGEPLTPESGLLTANQKLRRGAIETRFAREIEELYA
jgi:long-chain acyl-CoA synthetase